MIPQPAEDKMLKVPVETLGQVVGQVVGETEGQPQASEKLGSRETRPEKGEYGPQNGSRAKSSACK